MDSRQFFRRVAGAGALIPVKAAPVSWLRKLWDWTSRTVLRRPTSTTAECVALQLEMVKDQLPTLYLTADNLFGAFSPSTYTPRPEPQPWLPFSQEDRGLFTDSYEEDWD